MPTLERREWNQWQNLCALLLTMGVVTQQDLETPITRLDTPGQRLCHDLRTWGELRYQQGRVSIIEE